MPLAVLDFDVLALPDDLPDPSGYKGALVLLRLDGHPCGQALLAFCDGDDRPLRNRLFEAADSSFWEAWLRHELGTPLPPPGPVVPLPAATVAICTRDRPHDLERCLHAILAMPDDGQEILVVDNAPSTDAVFRLARRLERVRYVREDVAGLDVARNRALREAANEIIAFTDDDAAPDPLWLRSLLRNFADPLVLASTGLTMAAELETEAQILFQRFGGFTRGFKRITFDAASHDPLLAWQAGAGVNMAVRSSVLDLVGPFDEALDAGTRALAGGDSDLFRRILAAGYRIVYDPEALNWHRHRRTMAELEQQLFGYEVAASSIRAKAFLYEGNWAAALHALGSARRQIRAVARSAVRRRRTRTLRLQLAQLRGGVVGAFRYLGARRRAARAR